MDDPTNFDPTYALRNAIRSIVKVQEDLPVALRKENIIALAERGNRFRDELLEHVNDALDQCRFSYEAFTGMLRVEIPRTTYLLPDRVVQHFIPALSRVFKSHKRERFYFRGLGTDKASKRTLGNFLNPKTILFNVMGIEFRRQGHSQADFFELFLYPEKPRIKARKNSTVPVFVPRGQSGEWKVTKFEFPDNWWQFHDFNIKVTEDRKYYFRYFAENNEAKVRKGDKLLMARIMTKWDSVRWHHALRRSKYYPRCNFAVLCHKEGKKEIVDAIPQLRLNFTDGVFALCLGKYDLDKPEHEWVPIEREDVGRDGVEKTASSVLMKRR
jgi:hypothetical protein